MVFVNLGRVLEKIRKLNLKGVHQSVLPHQVLLNIQGKLRVFTKLITHATNVGRKIQLNIGLSLSGKDH